jgi:LytS/YehU family sensor histidine kinase
MESPWSALLANVAIVALFTSVWVHTHVWVDRRAGMSGPAFGLLMGIAAICAMTIPAEIIPGVLVDLRATVIGMAGFFGGPWSGLIAALLAGAFRIYTGGMGALAGSFSIAVAGLVGVLGYYFVKSRAPTRLDIVKLGAALGAGNLVGYGMLPHDVIAILWSRALIPSFALIFVSTVLAGLSLFQERIRR